MQPQTQLARYGGPGPHTVQHQQFRQAHWRPAGTLSVPARVIDGYAHATHVAAEQTAGLTTLLTHNSRVASQISQQAEDLWQQLQRARQDFEASDAKRRALSIECQRLTLQNETANQIIAEQRQSIADLTADLTAATLPSSDELLSNLPTHSQ